MQDSSDSIGKVLNGRYRLISLLGTGASANVYLAEDTTLERWVAVKLLQPALADDQAFLKRFRAEARAVAALNHPNVLQVYDWGEEDSVPFLVTEFLAGGSLSDVLAAGVRLTPEQAGLVGQQAAAGLAYAHLRGLVHRDVKPANLLFDDEGRLRITDFGVARALAEATWTEPAGAMIGTVRYASPEQAEGLPVDGKADVYSLGLVLYEAMTGELPFVGDTPLASLQARLGQSLPHNPLLGPLDAVLSEATDPDPVLRLDAQELERRLASVEALLPPPLPIPILSRHDAITDLGETVVTTTGIGFRAPSADELTQATPVVSGPARAGVTTMRSSANPLAPTVIAAPPTSPDGPDHRGRRRRRWPWIVALVVALIAGLVGVAFATKVFVPSVSVPSVIDQPNAKARAMLSADHLSVVFAPAIYSIKVPQGHVISQQPRPGISVKQGSSVTLVLSRGFPPVPVPPLATLTCAQAQAALTAQHLTGTCPPEIATYSSTVPVDQVVSYTQGTTANPTSVAYGSALQLILSKGPPPIPIPAVSGTFAQASATLTAAGFNPVQANEFSTTVPAGQVTRTSPAVGTGAQKSSTVTVYVSLGVGVVVPSGLVGTSVANAIKTLEAVGLHGSFNGSSAKIVTSTSPGSGTMVVAGSTIKLNS